MDHKKVHHSGPHARTFFTVTRKSGYPIGIMVSLAKFQHTLAPVFGYSVPAMYERQKALVRMGILPKATGRGWASGGATANPHSVAWMIMSVLATDNLSEVPTETPALAECGVFHSAGCPFPKNTIFVDAVASILADIELAFRVNRVGADRKFYGGAIEFTAPEHMLVRFHRFRSTPPDDSLGFFVHADLTGLSLVRLAYALIEEE